MELEDDLFSPTPCQSVHVLEGAVKSHTSHEIRVSELSLPEFSRWLEAEKPTFPADKKAPVVDTIRLVCVTYDGSKHRLNLNKKIWTQLAAEFELHPLTGATFLDNNGAFAAYYSTASGTNTLSQTKILLKVPNKARVGHEAVSLSYDHRRRRLSALIHNMSEDGWEKAVAELHQHIELINHPGLLPSLLFMGHRLSCEKWRASLDWTILEAERETGYGVPGRTVNWKKEAKTDSSAPTRLPFDSLLRHLYSCSAELSTLITVMRFSQESSTYLLDCTRRLDELDAAQKPNGQAIRDLIELPRSQIRAGLNQAQALKDRVQGQTNLLFGLISQNENKISQLVAAESANIAFAARRDGTAMKTIALMTMLFLPATFVAAFLSMPFFDWSPDSGESPISSRFIWVYWVITVPLTIIIIVGWQVWWKLEDGKSLVYAEKIRASSMGED